ncbi:MAG: Uma2 family endonuclease [Cyanothece sp. SIO2G6]|nr:Uma2 family endonuclease [Cyanothece sp. SIO2G6]
MVQILIKPLFPQLDRFLANLKPSDTTREFIDGRGYQKPRPQGTTIHLQTQLWDTINAASPVPQQAIAYPNHRCSFGAWSLVPTLAIFFDPLLSVPPGDSAPQTDDSQADDSQADNSQADAQPPLDYSPLTPTYTRCPDWVIEVILPEQHSTQPLRSVLHCLSYGSQMAWLIDPGQHLVFVFRPDASACEFKQNQVLPVPEQVDLTLTVGQILSWIPAKR